MDDPKIDPEKYPLLNYWASETDHREAYEAVSSRYGGPSWIDRDGEITRAELSQLIADVEREAWDEGAEYVLERCGDEDNSGPGLDTNKIYRGNPYAAKEPIK